MKLSQKFKRKKAPILNLTYFACMYGRPELSAIFLRNVQQLQTAFKEEIRISLAIAFSEDEDYQVIEASGIDATIAKVPNTYVGKKWNAALSLAQQHFGEHTHYFVKADDDGVLTTEGMRALIAAMRQGHDYIGFGGEIYLAPERSLASFATYPIPHKVMGTLKAYSHNALAAAAMNVAVHFIQRVDLEHFRAPRGETRLVPYRFAEWLIQHGIAAMPQAHQQQVVINLWENEWQRNLDWNSDLRLAYHGVKPHVLHPDKPALFNIKLPGKNIWEYDMRKNDGQPYSYHEALNLMHSDERDLLLLFETQKESELSIA